MTELINYSTQHQWAIKRYGDGEQTCCVCNRPLPPHETWPGARHPNCGEPECRASLKLKPPFSGKGTAGIASKVGLYIGPNERKCDGPDCTNFLPEGRYDLRATSHFCCGKCWFRRRLTGDTVYHCDCGCGEDFTGRRDHPVTNGLRFKSQKHYGAYLKDQHAKSSCGVFLPIVNEFLNGFAALHYREYYTITQIAPLFEFLNLEKIESLDDVTPKTITAYLVWGEHTDHRNVPWSIPFVSTFFKWAIASGHRKYANPVVSLIHRKRRPKYLPRPLEPEQLHSAWKILNERGNARLRLVTALGEEAGLRISEICRLRISDVDVTRMRLLVRLPNKGNTERYAFFSEKTKRLYSEWMAERYQECHHDRLLHGKRGKPCNLKSLTRELSSVLCKTYGGEQFNDEGFDKWSSHQMRHTLASKLVSAGANASTVMAALGHKSYEAMCGYARVDPEVARRGYDSAMQEAREQKRFAPRKKSINLAELLERTRKKA